MATTTGKATDLITFSRGSLATVTDSDGKVKWAPHNLALNSATPATQNITTIVGAKYKVEMTGSGSVALSGAGTGTASAGTPAEITATTTTLTLTVSGTVSTMWCYRSDLGGMQLNGAGTTYNVTTSSAYYGPRLDFDPATLAAKGLLVEEQRSNLATYSDDFSNAAWTPGGLLAWGSGSTINYTTSPSGAADADSLVEDSSTGNHRVYRTATVTAGASYSVSVYVKRASGYRNLFVIAQNNSDLIYANFNLGTNAVIDSGAGGTGSLSSAKITALANGWYRLTISGVISTSATSIFVQFAMKNDGATGNSLPSYAGDGTSGIYLWGAQLEAGSFATSHIPTAGATVTRSADVASVATSQFPYSASASTIVMAFDFLAAGPDAHLMQMSSAASPLGLAFFKNAGSLRVDAYVDGTSAALIAVTANTPAKAAIAYDGSSNGAVVNGGTVSAVGTTATTATKLAIGTGYNNNYVMSGHIRQISYFPRRMTNAELQQRTAA